MRQGLSFSSLTLISYYILYISHISYLLNLISWSGPRLLHFLLVYSENCNFLLYRNYKILIFDPEQRSLHFGHGKKCVYGEMLDSGNFEINLHKKIFICTIKPPLFNLFHKF